MARIWFPFSSRLLNHPESVLIHRTTLSFPHLLPLASHRSRTQAPIDLVLRQCVPWLQEPEPSSMETGLQGALGSDDPASRSVEDGSQEAAAATMSAGTAVRSWARAEVGSSEEMIGLLCAATESDAVACASTTRAVFMSQTQSSSSLFLLSQRRPAKRRGPFLLPSLLV